MRYPDGVLLTRADDIDVDAALATFHEQGFARLGPVLTSAALQGLRDRANAIMLGEVRHQGLFYQHDSASGRYQDLTFGRGWCGPSLAYRKIEGLERDPIFRGWIENQLFARIAHRELGRGVQLYRAVLWNKAAGAGTELPWHQDDGVFWGLDRAPRLQIWTALDDASPAAGCVEVVPGSHLGGLASRQGGTIPTALLHRAESEPRSLPLPARAGEAILLHNHVWHRSGRNATTAPRRGIGIAFLDAETRCRRRKRPRRNFVKLFAAGSPDNHP